MSPSELTGGRSNVVPKLSNQMDDVSGVVAADAIDDSDCGCQLYRRGWVIGGSDCISRPS